MGWRDTARNTRRALKTTVVARELCGAKPATLKTLTKRLRPQRTS